MFFFNFVQTQERIQNMELQHKIDEVQDEIEKNKQITKLKKQFNVLKDKVIGNTNLILRG